MMTTEDTPRTKSTPVASANTPQENQLLAAARAGEWGKIMTLCAEGVNPNIRNIQNQSALCLAALGGWNTCIRELLAAGAKFDPEALYQAICGTHAQCADTLWEAATAEERTDHALHERLKASVRVVLADWGEPFLPDVVLEVGDIVGWDEETLWAQRQPLDEQQQNALDDRMLDAAWDGNEKELLQAIVLGANCYALDENGNTATIIAIENNFPRILEELIRCEVPFDTDALCRAVQNNSFGCATILWNETSLAQRKDESLLQSIREAAANREPSIGNARDITTWVDRIIEYAEDLIVITDDDMVNHKAAREKLNTEDRTKIDRDLISAVYNNVPRSVRDLYIQGASPDARDETKDDRPSACFIAFQQENLVIFDMLQSTGAQFDRDVFLDAIYENDVDFTRSIGRHIPPELAHDEDFRDEFDAVLDDVQATWRSGGLHPIVGAALSYLHRAIFYQELAPFRAVMRARLNLSCSAG